MVSFKSLLVTLASVSSILAKNTTRSPIEFLLLHCDNSLSRTPYDEPDPHGTDHRTFNLIQLYSPTSNTTQYVSPSPAFPYNPYAGATNMSAFFWTYPDTTLPRGLLSVQIPSTAGRDRLKIGVNAGEVLFEEQEFVCVVERGIGRTGGGPKTCGQGFCASWNYCGERYTCKQWEVAPPSNEEKVCEKPHGVDTCYPLWQQGSEEYN